MSRQAARRGRGGQRPRRRSVEQSHRDWLELVDTEGPFLAVPPLRRVYPSGILPPDRNRLAVLRGAKPAFDRAWDELARARLDPSGAPVEAALARYRTARDAWVETVLRQVVGWDGEAGLVGVDHPLLAGCVALSPTERVRVAPTWGLAAGGLLGALVLVVDPAESLRQPGTGDWTATPLDRMELMLRAGQAHGGGCSVGLVTDGRWWALVSAPPGGMAASGVVDAQTWIEEPAVRDAFIELLGVQRVLGGEVADRLPALFKESVLAAEEITEALGGQVRRAVELLVSAFSEAGRAAREQGHDDPLPAGAGEVYEAAVTVMMRVVFLLFAQERGLLPESEIFTRAYGLTGVLDELEARAQQEGEEALDATALTWHRLLATSQALARGASFEDLRLPAYGGSLFETGRHPFLAAVTERGTLRVSVPDRVMLQVLRAVQVAQAGKEARRVCFRDLDVEQIGYIYEGLLGYTAHRATGTIVGLVGGSGDEPEIPLEVLDELAEEHLEEPDLAGAIRDWLKTHQPGAKPPTKAALAKALLVGDSLEDAERALLAVSPDPGVRDALRPWIGAIRRDLRGKPTVVLPGGLYVAEIASRRNAGAYYTPRSLAEEVVRHALEPVVYSPGPYQTDDRSQWRLLSADDLLDLKVADIACGSGAFLVAAARFLARALIEAWTAEGRAEGRSGQALESRALREVVSRCLYGVDINPIAVEMCKLSLWLVSLDRELPFSFVDDKVLVGNSLLGITSRRQLTELRIDPDRARERGLLEVDAAGRWQAPVDVTGLLARVAERRRSLSTPVVPHDPQRDTNAKRQIYAGIQAELATALRLADAVVAAGLAAGGTAGKNRDQAYQALRSAVLSAYPTTGEPDDRSLEMILAKGLTPTVETDYSRWQCLHWPLVLPDVMGDHGGFDAIVGNPPFRGGQFLTGDLGKNLRAWYVNTLAGGTRGSADLAAYFFLRAMSLLRPTGTLGLLAPNTIAQGAVRKVGLEQMVEQGFTITRAIRSRRWPTQAANLEYAAVWGTPGPVSETPRVCDDRLVPRISALLEASGAVSGAPVRLQENQGISFIGCYVLGKGFVLEPAEAQEWIAQDPRNAEVLFPYLNGEDLNSRPDASPSRWVIDFNDWAEERAAQYSLPFRRLSLLVKPERQRTKPDGTFALRRPLPERWWQYGEKRPAMRQAIKDLDEVLVIALVSKTVMPLRVPTGQVFSHMLGVFASGSFSLQALVSSSLHQYWAITYGSGMRNDPRYTPSNGFETFPRPRLTPESEAVLEEVGRRLDTERREIMLRRNLGLTKLYNLVNDPALPSAQDSDVARLRQIHTELDQAVVAAYGWSDVALGHGFHEYRGMTRWTISPAARVTVLDRLLALNHERAEAQKTTPTRKGTA